MMKLSAKGEKFLHQEEGVRLTAYAATPEEAKKGIYTIGYGNTFYADRSPVKKGDKLTKEQADSLFKIVKEKFEAAVNKAVKTQLTQNQFDALMSLIWNIGVAAFNRSTVLRLVNKNPADPKIGDAFRMWKMASGKPILLARRNREVELYFSK